MTQSELFDLLAPELASSANKSKYLELGTLQTSSCYFGTDYDMAVALRAAHIGTLANRYSGDGGEITSKREGDLAVTYSATGNSSGLNGTKYGQQLQELINNKGGGISVAGYYGRC